MDKMLQSEVCQVKRKKLKLLQIEIVEVTRSQFKVFEGPIYSPK